VETETELERDHLLRAVECLLLVGGGPVRIEQLREVLNVPDETVRDVLRELTQIYGARGLQIQPIAGGYQLTTRPEFAPYVARFLGLERREPLSRAALETLAIVAYRQPVTRAEIEAVRGVRCEHVLQRLGELELIRELGRRPTLGRPILYGTTDAFLRHFGLKDLTDLPPLEGHDPRQVLAAQDAAADTLPQR
jgi:segregation and condensation protein B